MDYNKSGLSHNRRNTIHNENAAYNLPEAKRALKKRKRKNNIAALGAVIVLVIIAVWLIFDKLFVIRRFEIQGKSQYTSEQAENAAESIGISKGGHIFGFDRKTAQELAKYHLSQFDSVEIAFEMPDTVVLKVQEAVPSMYVIFGDNGYVLSEGLRVISAHPDASDCEEMGLVRIELDGISKCVAGEFLTSSGGNDEILKQLYAVLKEEGLADDVTAIDVADKFDISFEYKKQFEVKLGDYESLTVKIRYMKAIVDELAPSDSGIIDVSDDEHRDATFKPYSKM